MAPHLWDFLYENRREVEELVVALRSSSWSSLKSMWKVDAVMVWLTWDAAPCRSSEYNAEALALGLLATALASTMTSYEYLTFSMFTDQQQSNIVRKVKALWLLHVWNFATIAAVFLLCVTLSVDYLVTDKLLVFLPSISNWPRAVDNSFLMSLRFLSFDVVYESAPTVALKVSSKIRCNVEFVGFIPSFYC